MAVILRLPDLSENSLTEAERAVIVRALRQSGGHAETAADLLGIGASTMYRKCVEHKITEQERYG
jgi:DNA-binding NtrC family response regulator